MHGYATAAGWSAALLAVVVAFARFEGILVAVQLNHTIVSVRDKQESATALAELLGLAPGSAVLDPTRRDAGRARSTPTTMATASTGRTRAVTSWRSSPSVRNRRLTYHAPAPRYARDTGRVSATFRPVSHPAQLTSASGGGDAHYLATGASTGGEFGLYRWEMGSSPSGPDGQFHKTISVEATSGDFLFVPGGGQPVEPAIIGA